MTAPLWSPHSSDPLTASFDIFPSSPLIPSPAADDIPTSCRPVPLCRRRNHPCIALHPEVHAPASGAAPTRNSPAPAASAQVRWCEARELAVHTRRAVIRVEESVKEQGGGGVERKALTVRHGLPCRTRRRGRRLWHPFTIAVAVAARKGREPSGRRSNTQSRRRSRSSQSQLRRIATTVVGARLAGRSPTSGLQRKARVPGGSCPRAKQPDRGCPRTGDEQVVSER